MHHSCAIWKQEPSGTSPFWQTACCISRSCVVRAYSDCNRVSIGKEEAVLAERSPEYFSSEKYGTQSQVKDLDVWPFVRPSGGIATRTGLGSMCLTWFPFVVGLTLTQVFFTSAISFANPLRSVSVIAGIREISVCLFD